MKKASIYTRQGDGGTTALANGTRVGKDDPRVEAYGTLDELCAQLGLLAVALSNHPQLPEVERAENNILSIASILATPGEDSPTGKTEIEHLETTIDELNAQLPPLQQFLLPSLHHASAQANLCRTICRRAERRITTLANNSKIPSTIPTYINRLSDYLFVLSRAVNNTPEKNWERYWK